MSSAPLNPLDLRRPMLDLPARMRAGDLLATTLQTHLPSTAVVFFVLTAQLSTGPSRFYLPAAVVPLTGAGAFPVLSDGTVAISVPTSITAAWLPGSYAWVLLAVDTNGNRTELGQGNMVIDPDVAGATPLDPRTQNERDLAAIRATIQARMAGTAVAAYKIGTREVTNVPLPELLRLEAIVEGRVINSRRRRGLRAPSRGVDITFRGDC